MKFFLYSSMVEKAMINMPSEWYGSIHLTSDKKIVALDESIADRSYNINQITSLGLKDIFILQDSFLEVIKDASKFRLVPKSIAFDVDIEEEDLDELKSLFSCGEFLKAAKRIALLMDEYECEIRSLTFFDKNVAELVEISKNGVIYILGDFNVNEWFEKAYYFYVLSDYRLPDEAGGLLQ
ncbi:hypothetical protein [Brevibacillus sp. NRS-1366]|uniref:hypothetical protein n=1 Tax=Brevibacillus sp. NRS-1366 TaxID=3233899 RepID=UPI003D1A0713